MNGVTPAGKHQVVSGQPAAGRADERPEESRTFAAEVLEHQQGAARAPAGARFCGQEGVYLCSGPGSLHFLCRSHQSSLPSDL